MVNVMVPANKILTVAYGTFSCTLEGFDDPFSTMTDIAEYFRGLAAEDRYFGAEPPTPDMAMLRQIAENTSRRAVDARSEGGAVTLRPAAVAAEAPESEAQEDLAALAAVHTDSGKAELTLTSPIGRDVAEAEVSEVDSAEAESAAAKLERIRNVVAADNAAEEYSEDEHAGETSETSNTISADEAITPADEGVGDLESPAIAEALSDDSDIAAALEAMPDVAAEADADEFEDLLATEDEMNGEDSLSADLAALFQDDEPAEHAIDLEVTRAEVAVEDVAPIEEETTSQEAEAATTTEVEETPQEEATDAPEPALEEAVAEAAPAIATPRRIRVRKVRRDTGNARATAVAAAAAASAVEPEESAAQTAQAESTPPAPVEEASGADLSLPDAEEVALMEELAAIEAELGRDATGKTAAADESFDEDAFVDDGGEQDADDLMTELAAIRAVEGDDAPIADTPALAEEPEVVAEEPDDIVPVSDDVTLDEDDVPEDVPAAASPEAVTDEPKTKVSEAVEKSDPQDLERLFAATNSRLSGKDTSRRHANISHLKAAVAARRADDTMETVKQDESGAYRDDLASSVRPRRSEPAPEAKTARPERTAPLVLVSEQRVGDAAAAAPAPAEPVTPRRAPRVSDADARAEAELEVMRASQAPRSPDLGDDFEQFAQDVGATDLADILEAAAVYSATVMGQDNFSRPRLLHLAAEAVDDLSREDGLRGFGQLLRDGTLRKVSRGTFALGGESRFREQAKRRVG